VKQVNDMTLKTMSALVVAPRPHRFSDFRELEMIGRKTRRVDPIIKQDLCQRESTDCQILPDGVSTGRTNFDQLSTVTAASRYSVPHNFDR
jgi:hypothetical protein